MNNSQMNVGRTSSFFKPHFKEIKISNEVNMGNANFTPKILYSVLKNYVYNVSGMIEEVKTNIFFI